jgi:hypothetical protein
MCVDIPNYPSCSSSPTTSFRFHLILSLFPFLTFPYPLKPHSFRQSPLHVLSPPILFPSPIFIYIFCFTIFFFFPSYPTFSLPLLQSGITLENYSHLYDCTYCILYIISFSLRFICSFIVSVRSHKKYFKQGSRDL